MTGAPQSASKVQPPAKARTISQFLGKNYVVESSIGHIRDLPSSASEIPTSYNEARVIPAHLSRQRVLTSNVDIAPVTWQTNYVDYWDTRVTAFEILRPHAETGLRAGLDEDRRTAGKGDAVELIDPLGRLVRLVDHAAGVGADSKIRYIPADNHLPADLVGLTHLRMDGGD